MNMLSMLLFAVAIDQDIIHVRDVENIQEVMQNVINVRGLPRAGQIGVSFN